MNAETILQRIESDGRGQWLACMTLTNQELLARAHVVQAAPKVLFVEIRSEVRAASQISESQTAAA